MVEFPKPQRLGQYLGLGDNPLYQSFGANRNAIIQGFAGIGGVNPAQGFSQGFANGAMLDQQYADQAAEEAEEQQSKNATLEWLKQQGYTDLVAGVEGGGLDMGTAWSEGLKRSQPQQSEMTADMRNFYLAQDNPEFAQFIGAGEGEMTDTQRNLEWRAAQAGLQPGSPEYQQFMMSGGSGSTSLSVDPATGAVSFSQGFSGRPLTEQQSKDTVYAVRAEGALPVIDALGSELMNPIARSVEGDPTGLARGALQSANFQKAQQAGKEFLQAILRKDTGAAITPQETSEYGSVYLPLPGDQQAVLDQKREARQRALEALKAGMPPQAILAQEKALSQSGAAGSNANPIAVNPQTGQRVRWDGSSWVPFT